MLLLIVERKVRTFDEQGKPHQLEVGALQRNLDKDIERLDVQARSRMEGAVFNGRR